MAFPYENCFFNCTKSTLGGEAYLAKGTVKKTHLNKLKNVAYKKFSPEYLDEVLKIANARFGENYYTKENFMETLNKSEGMCIVAIEKKTNEVLGYCIFYGEKLEEAEKHFKLSQEELSNISGGDEKICHTKSMAIKKKCEKAGIGSTLFEKTLEEAQKLGYKTALCPAWEINGQVPVANILDKNDFVYHSTVGDLWKDDENYKCVVCNGPCRCNAAIYYKKFS